ncbi:MAG: hypothetical protein HQL00_16370 [Nitrospirae bacterium]|nr:hypothetical protein [Nitrospirota bacterium]
MSLIIPAAGQSQRFPEMRPKWMLTHPNGNLMVTESIRGLDLTNVGRIYLVILKEHVDRYNCLSGLAEAFRDIGVEDRLTTVVLDTPTNSQPETIARAIEHETIKGPIFIKDSDNTFNCKIQQQNAVAVYDISKMPSVNAGNKSYIMLDDNKLVKNIVEKQVISSFFCTGGYSFLSADEYLRHFNKLKSYENLYVSHIIYDMLLENSVFEPLFVTDYADWGTLEDWNAYKATYSTIFVDLDGVLMKNSGQYFDPLWGTASGIKENIGVINKLYNTGRVNIIITTARKETYKAITIRQLQEAGICYHQIIFGIFHSKRVIINDYSRTNPFKSCDAINIKRDSADLREMLEDSLRFTNL